VGHRPGAALLHRQAGLGAVERLDLALFIDREDDGMGGRIDIETDDVAQLVDDVCSCLVAAYRWSIVGQHSSATNIPSACRIANIAINDAMILPYDANLARMKFSERTGDEIRHIFFELSKNIVRSAARGV
jgi:hypothetical protein